MERKLHSTKQNGRVRRPQTHLLSLHIKTATIYRATTDKERLKSARKKSSTTKGEKKLQ